MLLVIYQSPNICHEHRCVNGNSKFMMNVYSEFDLEFNLYQKSNKPLKFN